MFTKRIQQWYEKEGRDLPWRNTKDPYLIWLSEVILQQTRVAQGYDYFLRFKKRFPTVKDLARADEDEVLKYWQGLGYYSRARNLHAAARSIKGEFPQTYKEVRALKGVGDYTAAAICSFAFDLPYAVVDGNVYRVLARYFGIDTPIDKSAGKKEFAALAQELLDKEHPARYNQAIMDFGALQCTPKSPNCSTCPLVESCIAYQENNINSLPVKTAKTKVRHRYFHFFYLKQGPYTYIQKRQGQDIWKNLFQFPLVESKEPLSLEYLLQNQEVQALFEGLQEPTIRQLVEDYKHVLSHQHLHTNFYELEVGEQ
ncbi:MAG: A/G-specific adenine glycosylase, partial [Bacteroides sp.]